MTKKVTLIEQDRSAAAVYLKYWQIMNETPRVGGRGYKKRNAKMAKKYLVFLCKTLLRAGYISPKAIKYDAEATPVGANWRSKKFDFQGWVLEELNKQEDGNKD